MATCILRGSLNANVVCVLPGALDDQFGERACPHDRVMHHPAFGDRHDLLRHGHPVSLLEQRLDLRFQQGLERLFDVDEVRVNQDALKGAPTDLDRWCQAWGACHQRSPAGTKVVI